MLCWAHDARHVKCFCTQPYFDMLWYTLINFVHVLNIFPRGEHDAVCHRLSQRVGAGFKEGPEHCLLRNAEGVDYVMWGRKTALEHTLRHIASDCIRVESCYVSCAFLQLYRVDQTETETAFGTAWHTWRSRFSLGTLVESLSLPKDRLATLVESWSFNGTRSVVFGPCSLCTQPWCNGLLSHRVKSQTRPVMGDRWRQCRWFFLCFFETALDDDSTSGNGDFGLLNII